MKKLIILLAVLSAAVFAQEGERVRAELERTDRAITEAAPVIERSRNEEAQKLFGQAKQVQNDAWSMHRQRRYRGALDRTMRARELVGKAVRLAKFDPERVAEEIRRTQELMNEAGPAIVRSGNPKALELWKVAQTEQETGRRYFQDKQYLLALKFTMAARLHTKSALELIRGRGDPERVRLELERTVRLLERTRERVRFTAEVRVREMLRKAEGWQEEAGRALREERPLRALKMTFAARDLALRAWEIALGTVNQEMVDEALAELDRLVEQWSGPIREQGGEAARKTLEQALRHREQARQRIANREMVRAWQEAGVARRLVSRAVELLESGPVQPGETQEE